MAFPSPTEKQARILWFSLTALAIGILLTLLGLMCWGLAWVINQLSSVLLPLAMAGVVAFLLDPVVGLLERKNIPRARAILLVFFLAVMLVLTVLATVVPNLVVEIRLLIDQAPTFPDYLRGKIGDFMKNTPLGIKAREAWDSQLGASAQEFAAKAIPTVSGWLLSQLSRVASWAGLLAGLALVPVYIFYFLLEKRGIEKSWTDYLPLQESKIKDEIAFVLKAINDCLIVFFRGQVLVAMCDGALLTIGFLLMGLNYAFLLGVVAGFLSIIPYLGVMISLVPAVALAIVQFGNLWGPFGVLAIFGTVQLLEGLVISPKIIGDRVGLHPLTIIISVMIGTTLLGGILGGVLAIPLTAALRTLMFRYVWKRHESPGVPHRGQ